jgi:hypothetical protein
MTVRRGWISHGDAEGIENPTCDLKVRGKGFK